MISFSIAIIMAKIAIIVLLGFIFLKAKLIDNEIISFINKIVFNFTLPCLVLYSFFVNFKTQYIIQGLSFTFYSLAIAGVGYIVARLLLFVFRIRENINEFVSLIVFQNSGYLPLALAYQLFPEVERARAFLLIFFYLIGFNFLLFSLGIKILQRKKYNFKLFLNTPVLISFLGIFIVIIHLETYIPEIMIQFLKLGGETTIFLSLFILGAIIANIKFNPHKFWKHLVGVTIGRLFLVPIIFLIIFNYFSISSFNKSIMIIEASMPSAIFLSIIAKMDKFAELGLITQGIVFTHLISFITISIFLALI
jgi:hypothetical protein